MKSQSSYKRRVQKLGVFWLLSLVASLSLADLTGARVNPQSYQLIKDKDASFNVTWQVAANANSNNVISTPGEIISPKDGSVLGVFGSTLNQSGGTPFILQETITLPARNSINWFNAGLKTVILRRNFSDPAGGGLVSARMTLRLVDSSLSGLRDSAAGDLKIQNLRLEYPNGNDVVIVNLGENLTARLTLGFTGTGLLEGRWQLAQPNSNGEAPVFRTLALVRRNINTNQRTEISSPALPTENPGRFLLRFCVTKSGSSNVSEFCQEALSARSVYQVNGEKGLSVKTIEGIMPSRQIVNASTSFTWPALAGTSMYQLQIFSLNLAEDTLPSSKDDSKLFEPQFLVGMMLPKNQTKTPLSDVVRNKLISGQKYLWRLSAIDENGRLIGMSEEASFTYEDQ